MKIIRNKYHVACYFGLILLYCVTNCDGIKILDFNIPLFSYYSNLTLKSEYFVSETIQFSVVLDKFFGVISLKVLMGFNSTFCVGRSHIFKDSHIANYSYVLFIVFFLPFQALLFHPLPLYIERGVAAR